LELTITKDNLPKEIHFSNIATTEFILPQSGIDLEAVEKSFIEQALQLTDYNQTKAAKLLGITRHTLLYRIEKYDIEN
jgi:transcriptional regulator with PAS, ATPase and Fis domain